MTRTKASTVIIHGFDRSGSSAISQILASSNDVELFMQPFNSGPFREKMYEIWTNDTATDEDKAFCRGLAEGNLLTDYIKSPWFAKNSTSQKFVEGKTHLIKTTINHFSSKWMMENYPAVEHWAIWREPFQILDSLLRNDFIDKWYADAVQEISVSVRSTACLQKFEKYISEINSAARTGAFLIAVRTEFLFSAIDLNNIIFYHDFCLDPQKALENFVSRYQISAPDYSKVADDLNIIGAAFSSDDSASFELSTEDRAYAERIFSEMTYVKTNLA